MQKYHKITDGYPFTEIYKCVGSKTKTESTVKKKKVKVKFLCNFLS